MKKILTILIFLQLIYSASNAQIKLIGNITTNGKASYPTHIDSLGKGGMMVMPTVGSRDSIPSLRRKFGMLVYVQENDSLYKLKNTASAKKYTNNTDWITIGLNSTADVDRFLKYAKTSDSLYIIGNTIIGNTLKIDATSSSADSLQYLKNKEIDSANSVKLVIGGGVRVDSNLFVKGRNIYDSIMKYDTSKVNVVDTAAMLAKYARRFTKDVKLVLPTGGYLGKYQNGDSVLAKGKTLDEFLYDISTKQTAATYSNPSVGTGISGTTSFEIGTKNLPAISLYKSYNQSDAGPEVSPTTAIYYKDGVSLGAGVTTDVAAGTLSGTDRLLTTTITYQVRNVSYTAGSQKNDNLGNPSPYSVSSPGIPAGVINGSSVSISTFQYSYYGPSSSPVVSNYFRSQLQSAGRSQTLSFPGLSNQYIFYAYPSALGDLISIKIGGFESLGAFIKTTVNLVNASGYTMPYIVYTSQNFFNGTVNDIIFQ